MALDNMPSKEHNISRCNNRSHDAKMLERRCQPNFQFFSEPAVH